LRHRSTGRLGANGHRPCSRTFNRHLQQDHQRVVDALHRIVASLVVAVDGALVRHDLGVAGTGAPRQVLLGPQQAVAAMVLGDGMPKGRIRLRRNIG
jgi:hypothetical protein